MKRLVLAVLALTIAACSNPTAPDPVTSPFRSQTDIGYHAPLHPPPMTMR